MKSQEPRPDGPDRALQETLGREETIRARVAVDAKRNGDNVVVAVRRKAW